MTGALRTLTTDLIDYAGLYPPAKLDMGPAVEAYNRCKMGEYEFMLGRFICPVARLDEFSKHAAPLLPGTFARSGYRTQADTMEPWRLSAIVDPAEDFSKTLDAIDAFNAKHNQESNGLCAIDMLEIRVTEVNQIDQALDELPEDLFPFFEFPVSLTEGLGDCRGFVAALAGNKAGAKIRTGGIVGNAFPTIAEIATFLHACASADVPFKATAGLHHPIRSVHRLTYEPGSATCKMHGFLNLFLAAAVAKVMRPDMAVTTAILAGEDPQEFRFSEEVVGWKGHMITTTDLALVRESFALSFGSCSFDEPVEDLKALGVL
jgi:hypothetical protein